MERSLLILEKIIQNVLLSLYQGIGASVLMAVLFMFAYLYAKKCGAKETIKCWLRNFRDGSEFRRVFILAVYTSMILFRTVLYRSVWSTPLGKVLGTWGLHTKDGSLYTENIENIILFIPFIFLLFWALHNKIFADKKIGFYGALFKPLIISFCFSLSIEFIQLFFKLGTFQLSDLVFNTLGGVIGGIIYYCVYRIKERKRNQISK